MLERAVLHCQCPDVNRAEGWLGTEGEGGLRGKRERKKVGERSERLEKGKIDGEETWLSHLYVGT